MALLQIVTNVKISCLLAATSAVVSGWGATASAAAGFGQVGWVSFAKNITNIGKFTKNNASGLVIMVNEQVMSQAGSRAVKSATADKKKSSQK